MSPVSRTDSEPVRMCVICRRRLPKALLLRHVLSGEGNLVIDPDKTSPGRGWYLCSDRACAARFTRFRPRAKRLAPARKGRGRAECIA